MRVKLVVAGWDECGERCPPPGADAMRLLPEGGHFDGRLGLPDGMCEVLRAAMERNTCVLFRVVPEAGA